MGSKKGWNMARVPIKRTGIMEAGKIYQWQPSKKRNKLNAKSKSSSKGTATEQT